MKSFLPEFIACICGVVLGYGLRLWAKLVRARRAAREAAGAAVPPNRSATERAERRFDLISIIVCMLAVGILCSTTTPKGWQIAFLFGYLWPVILHQVLRYPEQVIRKNAARAEDGGTKGQAPATKG